MTNLLILKSQKIQQSLVLVAATLQQVLLLTILYFTNNFLVCCILKTIRKPNSEASAVISAAKKIETKAVLGIGLELISLQVRKEGTILLFVFKLNLFSDSPRVLSLFCSRACKDVC